MTHAVYNEGLASFVGFIHLNNCVFWQDGTVTFDLVQFIVFVGHLTLHVSFYHVILADKNVVQQIFMPGSTFTSS